jgi:3-oxoacyl-(acyl-carrier-protein) synthase
MAGVMEAAFCAVAIHDGFIPGGANLVAADPACAGLDLVQASVDVAPRVILNNSSGFGGSNVCHVLRCWTR